MVRKSNLVTRAFSKAFSSMIVSLQYDNFTLDKCEAMTTLIYPDLRAVFF